MAGLYIHIPFCKSRCKYCDFYSTTLLERRQEYVEAIAAEWKELRDRWKQIDTIYLGGGTPSVLEPDDILRLLAALPVRTAHEVTLEANPGDLNEHLLHSLRQAGVNRLSIGCQTFNDRLLSVIGRRHTAQQAREGVYMAQQSGFCNISIDLIYGLPGQTLQHWIADIEQALALKVQHISCYCLSYEAGTPMTQSLERGEIKELDEELLRDMYDTLCRYLQDAGYEHYEVSNFALQGYRSRHNSSYWNHVPYLGLGAGAHSYDGQATRWANPCDINAYIEGVMAHNLQRDIEHLNEEQQRIERIMLGLRTQEGIHENDIVGRDTEVQQRITNGELTRHNGKLVVTHKGLHVLNNIIENLI